MIDIRRENQLLHLMYKALAALPRAPGSIFVRTIFRHIGFTAGRDDYRTSTMTEPMEDFVAEWAN